MTGRAMKIRLLVLAVLCAGGAAPAAECPALLRVAGNRLFIPVVIAGERVEALLDSGAEMTLVDAALADRLGLSRSGSETARGTGGTAEVTFADDVAIEAAGVTLGDRMVAVLDLGDIATRVVGEPVPMVLGRELFDSGRFRIDIGEGRLCRVAADLAPPGQELPLVEHKGILQLPVVIDDLPPVSADFDLGNGNEVLIGSAYARENGLAEPGDIVGTREGGGLGGALERELVRLGTLTVGDATFDGVVAAIDPTDNAADANIGVSILRHFVITVDFPARKIWLLER